jgi:nitrogen PTS system EIIA component
VFENQHAIARATVTDNLFARERLGSTGLGHGVAIPHGRIKGLKNPLAAVLRVQQPIPFDAPDDEAVGLLIFLLVPRRRRSGISRSSPRSPRCSRTVNCASA